MHILSLLITYTAALILNDNGLLLEPAGTMYIFGQFATFNIHIERDLPLEQLLKMDFENCPCYDIPQNSEQSCATRTKYRFRKTVYEKLNSTLNELIRESEELGYTQKRSVSSMLLGFINVGWNSYQEIEITNLRKIALKSSSSIKKIAESIRDLDQQVHVINENVYEDITRLDQKICRESRANLLNSMNFHASEIISSFLQQVDNEIACFIEKTVPKRLEYIHLFKGICLKTCKDLSESICVKFCQELFSNLPTDFTPNLKSITTEATGLVYQIDITIPVLTNVIKELHRVKAFGIIQTINNISYRKIPDVQQFAISSDNTTLSEIDTRSCYKVRKNMLCTADAFIEESCLSDESYCKYNWQKTRKTCTWRYTQAGVALFTKTSALVKEPAAISINKPETLSPGIHFVKSKNSNLEIHCTKTENIMVPAMKEIQNISVTILQKIPDLIQPKWEHKPIPLHLVNLNYTIQKRMDEILEEHNTLSDTSMKHRILSFSIAICSIISISILIYSCITSYKKITLLKSEINRLRPML